MIPGPRYIEDPETLVGGNSVRLLRNGREAFPAWLDAIEAARARVSLEMYIFSDDTIGRRFAAALVGASARGVAVRLLYDYVGCRDTPAAFFEALRAGGVHTIAYHRPRFGSTRFWNLWRRNHRKVLVCDGAVAFTGGLNISDEWLEAEAGGGGWHDAAVRLEGPVVATIEATFLATWNRRARRRARLAPEGLGKLPAAGDARVAVVHNSELRDRFAIRRAGLHAARESRTRIVLANPYFVPDRGILRALAASVARGLDVRLLVPRVSDSRVIDLAARAVFERLLRAGVRIWRSPAFIHTKLLAVDDAFVSIGSYNLDHRSLAYNLELVVNILDAETNAAAVAMLEEDMAASTELKLDAFVKRSWFVRLLERAAYALRRWL
ncbi:MAG TPA: phospholipase D-like domain-containing protein [Polyangia bacterium]|nr:phospholipase D-like domain-containing protein [Polyangia bacterium]